KSMVEFNIEYNNLKREAGIQNEFRDNEINHYLNRIPTNIEAEIRRWLSTQENTGIEPPLKGTNDSVQSYAEILYSQQIRQQGELNARPRETRYFTKRRTFNQSEELQELKEQNRLLKEQIEAFQHKGFISRGKNKDFFTG